MSRTSLTLPHPDKWRAHEEAIAACQQAFEPTWRRIQDFVLKKA
jgi:hypothetical protein